MPSIDPLSAASLYVELLWPACSLGSATAFVVDFQDRHFLISNSHVFSGRNRETGRPITNCATTPERLRIYHHGKTLGTWVVREEVLFAADGSPRWVEHPGNAVDVAALLLEQLDDEVCIRPFDLSLASTDVVPQVAMSVSIIGFPLGLTGPRRFPIWKTGHIASDPELDYQDKPAFLIDATTRGGMSGSPVVMRPSGAYKTKLGTTAVSTGVTLFLGVYSGRIHGDSEIGIVWRPQTVTATLARAQCNV